MTTTSSPALSLPGDRRQTSTGDEVAEALAAIDRGLDLLATAALGGVDDQRTRDLLLWAARSATRLTAVELRLLRHGDEVDAGRRAGASSTATWFALAVRRSRKSTHYRARLARDLLEHPEVENALTRGDVGMEQARAILDETRSVAPGDRAAAVGRLIGAAGVLGADSLRVEGRRTLRAVADVPALGDGPGRPEAALGDSVEVGPVGPVELGPVEVGPVEVGPDGPSGVPSVVLAPVDADAATLQSEGSEAEAEVPAGPVLTLQVCPAAAGAAAVLDLGDETPGSFVCGHFKVPRAVALQLREVLRTLLVGEGTARHTAADLGRAFCELVATSGGAPAATAPAVVRPSPTGPGGVRPTARRRRLRLWPSARGRVAATA